MFRYFHRFLADLNSRDDYLPLCIVLIIAVFINYDKRRLLYI